MQNASSLSNIISYTASDTAEHSSSLQLR